MAKHGAKHNKYKIILFDLDDTLTDSRQAVEPYMAELFTRLLDTSKTGVVSGCALHRMDEQLLRYLPCNARLDNLYLFPSTASCYYRFLNGSWKCLHNTSFSDSDKQLIISTLLDVCQNYISGKDANDVIEDRGGQIAIALLGLNAPLLDKRLFDPERIKRQRIKEELVKRLPFEITIGGTTTITVTSKGLDKTHCLTILLRDGIQEQDIVYVGDAFYSEGNDYPFVLSGVECIPVSSPRDTANVIAKLLKEGQ